MDSYSVQAVLSVKDQNFTSGMRSASSALSGLDSDTSKSTKSVTAFGAAFAVANKAISGICNVIVNSFSSAVSRVDTLNQSPKIMQQMGFSADSAENSISKLSDGIQGLPTSLDSIVSSTQSIAILTGDLDMATDSALALNDAFLASGSSTSDAERGLTQYTQMLSSGKVDMQSWKTLQETMGYALSETAKELGITSGNTQELYTALQSGEITFDELNAAIIECDQCAGGFAETASIASEGIATSWQNVQTAVVRGVANVIQAWNDAAADNGIPTIQESLQGLQGVVNTVFGAASKAVTAFANNLDLIVSVCVPVVAGITSLKVISTVTSQFNKFTDSGKKAADALNNYTSKAERTADASKKVETAEKNLKNAEEKHRTAVNNLYDATEKLNQAEEKKKTAAENLAKAQEKAKSSTEDSTKAAEEQQAAEKELEAAIKEVEQAEREKADAEKAAASTSEQYASAENLSADAHQQEANAVEGATMKEIAHNAILAVMTGKMGLAEAAQKALNAAMDANPIGMVITAITALVSVLTAVTTVLKKFGIVNETAYSQAKDLKDETDELCDSLDEEAAAMDESIENVRNESSVISALCDDVAALTKNHNKSEKEIASLKSTLSVLNDEVEGLDAAYDETTDSLNMSTKALIAYCNAASKQEEVNTIEEAYLDTLNEMEAIEDELTKATEQRAATEQMAAEVAETGGIYGVLAAQKEQKAIEELTEEKEAYTARSEELLEELQAAEEEQAAAAAEAARLQSEAIAESVASQTLTLEELSDENQETAQALQATWQDYTDAATNMFDTLDTTVEVSVTDMIENMRENQRIMAEWGDNCEDLRDRFVALELDQAVLDQLVDLGPEGAGYIAELVEASDDELIELSETFANGGEVAFTAMGDSMGEGAAEVMDQAKNLIKDTETSLRETVENTDWTSVGESMTEGVAEGITSSEAANEGASEMAEDAYDAAAKDIGMGSPAKKWMPIGESMVEGVGKGMSDSSAAMDAAKQMADNVKTSVENALEKIDLSGATRSMMNGFSSMNTDASQQMSAINTTITNAMTKMNTAFTSGTDKVKKTASTATDSIKKTFDGLQDSLYTSGVNAMKGFQNGMDSRRSNVLSTAQSIANSVTNTINKALQVGSPSKVLMKTGKFADQGLVNGLKSYLPKIKDVSLKIADTVSSISFGGLDEPALAFDGGMTLSYETGNIVDGIMEMMDRPIEINVPLEVDGKEIARATASYMQDEQDRLESRNSRKQMFQTGG